jgi:hypothetical protein
MSTPPRSVICPITVSVPSTVAMSAAMNSSAARWSGACRPVAVTCAPALVRRAAMAAPMPRVPPLTSARFPVRPSVSMGDAAFTVR